MLRNLPIDWKAIRGNSLFVKNWLRWASIVPKSNWIGTIFDHATGHVIVSLCHCHCHCVFAIKYKVAAAIKCPG